MHRPRSTLGCDGHGGRGRTLCALASLRRCLEPVEPRHRTAHRGDQNAVHGLAVAAIQLCRQLVIDPLRAIQSRHRETRGGRLSTRPQPRSDGTCHRRELFTLRDIDVAVDLIVSAAQRPPCHHAARTCFSAEKGVRMCHAFRTQLAHDRLHCAMRMGLSGQF
jgi:hypothetical protein